MVILLLLIAATVAGLALGLWFNVLVLVPAIGVSLAVGIISLAAAHNSRLAIVVGVIGVLTTLEVGYVVGSLLRAHSPRKFAASQRDWASTLPTQS